MTLVEFLDKSPIDNIAGSLMFRPERVIYIGTDSHKKSAQAVAFCEKYLREKGIPASVSYITVSKYDVSKAVASIERILGTSSDETVFDVTGGHETAIMAMGIVAERRKRSGRTTKVVSIDPAAKSVNFFFDRACSCDMDRSRLASSIEENAILHGGAVLKGNNSSRPVLSEDFLEALSKVWQIAMKCRGLKRSDKSAPRRWNNFVGLVLAHSVRSNGGTHFVISDARSKLKEDYKETVAYLRTLNAQGVIRLSDSDKNIVFDTLKGCERIIGKAGNLLELKIYSMAKNARGGVFSDAACGVILDWDGRIGDTENEIDVLLMKGIIPLFISCKNGRVEEEELYKLSSVAARFGGKYARKAIVISDYGGLHPSARSFIRRRAEDMGIRVIDNVHLMNERELERIIAKL